VLAAVCNSPSALAEACSELRSDKDFVMLCARSTLTTATCCYSEAHVSLKRAISFQSFNAAKDSALAIPGQKNAPVLCVTLNTVGSTIRAVAFLPSGRECTCGLPVRQKNLAVKDVAAKLLKALRRDPEVGEVSHVFLILKKSDGEEEPMTVWDHDRQLKDFILES